MYWSTSDSQIPKHAAADGVKWLMVPCKSVLKSNAIWPEHQNVYTLILHVLYAVSYLAVLVGQYRYVTENNIGIGQVCYTLSLAVVCVEALARRLFLYFYKEKFNSILSRVYHEFWPSRTTGDDLHKVLKRRSLVLFGYCLYNTTIGVTCVIRFIILPLADHDLPLRSAFFSDWAKTPYYEIIYVWNSILAFELVFNICGEDFFVLSLMLNGIAQFKLLGQFLIDEVERHRRRDKGDATKRILVKCVYHHNMLLEVCRDINEAITYLILLQYVTSAITVCVSSFAASTAPQESVTASTYLLGQLFELFIYCFMGNELTVQSTEISRAAFECGWHLSDVDADLQRSLVLIMLRSQRAVRVTAGGFSELSLPSFLKVLQFSFSVYTMLDTVTHKN